MGQQQLLLLVLATVIVGLATVAGISAFNENRQQAAADALQQKALNVTADIKGIDEKPEQMGGLPNDFSSLDQEDVAARLGFEETSGGTPYVPVSGAGTNTSETPSSANCQINNLASSQISIVCEGKGEYSELEYYGIYKQDPGSSEQEIKVQPSAP